jgi:hypothetical protein
VKHREFSDLIREVASAPSVQPKPLERQETIPAVPGELAASHAVPVPIREKSASGDLPWIPSPEEKAHGAMATAPSSLNTDNQKTVKAPPDYERQIAAMVEDAAREREIGNLSRRVQRLERILYAVLPNLLLIPQFLAKQRAVVTKATELLRRALIEERPAKSQGVGAAGAAGKKEG